MKKFFLISFILSLLMLSCKKSNLTGDCNKYKKWNNTYDLFEGSFNNRSDLTEVSKGEYHALKNYGKQINDLIINEKIEQLISNISKKNFKIYTPGETSSDISSMLIKQLKEKQGPIYNFLFDMMKSYDKNYKIDKSFGQDFDIKKYLTCFNNKLTWKIFFNPEEKFYILAFSIPDWLISHFSYFSYKVKKDGGKYILVGF